MPQPFRADHRYSEGESVETQNEPLRCSPYCYNRRAVLKAALVLGVGGAHIHHAVAQDADPRNARPQTGDQFVVLAGERQGPSITPTSLPVGGPPLTAYPKDPGTGVIRDGSRLNQVMLLRLDPAELTEATRTRSAEGVVAYSAVCTHTGCDVWIWQGDARTLKCPCHDSEFDPKEEARVLSGPAPRRLAALPLKVVDGVLVAVGSFVGRVGFKQD
jgi:Rieske Fe-S protein